MKKIISILIIGLVLTAGLFANGTKERSTTLGSSTITYFVRPNKFEQKLPVTKTEDQFMSSTLKMRNISLNFYLDEDFNPVNSNFMMNQKEIKTVLVN